MIRNNLNSAYSVTSNIRNFLQVDKIALGDHNSIGLPWNSLVNSNSLVDRLIESGNNEWKQSVGARPCDVHYR